MKNELSRKNKYHIPKERYLELLHFSRQYGEWLKEIKRLKSVKFGNSIPKIPRVKKLGEGFSRVEDVVMEIRSLEEKCEMVEQAAIKADSNIYECLIKAVTSGIGYDKLSAAEFIPCSRGYFYERYRKFFWILDKLRK